jgi:glycine betaine/proline transport system ATP-binding protein
MLELDNAIEFIEVDILFKREGGGSTRARETEALELLDARHGRAEILASTGIVVGISGANLCVRKGDISVLMGLSGSGKSTLLRAANALNPVTRGQVWVEHNGRRINVAECDPDELRRLRRGGVAMMFQQFGLLPWRTVRDNVGLGLELRGESQQTRRQKVDEKLELVGLSQWADHSVGELSGGMQQRVGLARAFATDADILLMDEPFSALDPLIRTRLQDELISLQRQMRKTILFVTHDLDEALRIGDRISVLEGGRIVQTGSPEDIVLRPQSQYVADFVQHMNPLTVLKAHMVMTRLLPDECTRLHGELPESPRLPADTPLKRLIVELERTGRPLLIEDSGRIAGVCTADDVVRALAGRHDAAKQAGDAN